MKRFGLLSCFLMFYVFSFSAMAQEDENTWSISLDSILIKGSRYSSPVKTNIYGVDIWSLDSMNNLPQILGNADPMHYAQMLPGIQTNSEYKSGINIEGCENQHNIISIDGVPIYNVNHLLGFFSTFNTSHFSSLSLAKGVVSANSPNRLGGQLDMQRTYEIPNSINGTISLGFISSQGTIDIPICSNTAVSTSFRGSYINLLYSQWLKVDEQQVRYSFYDANVSIIHRLSNKDILLFDFYRGSDNGSFSERHYLADMNARWGNTMGAIRWKHAKGGLSSNMTAYISSYRNTFSIDMEDMKFRLPSSITDLGVKSDIEWNRWNTGFEICWHDIHPQSLDRQGTTNVIDGHSQPKYSMETSVYLNYNYHLAPHIILSN